MDDIKLETIVNNTADRIAEGCRKSAEKELRILMEAIVSATKQTLENFCEGCEMTDNKEPEEKDPIQFEIHTRGVSLTPDDRLELSKMICDFLERKEYLDAGEEPEGEEPPIPEDEDAFIERVSIHVRGDGGTDIYRESSEGDSDE